MKHRVALLFFATATLASSQTTHTTPAVPPLRMGLWQSEITVEITGLPGSTGAPHTVVKRHCMTAESWKETMQQMQNQTPGCTTSNLRQDEHHLAFDQSCSFSGGILATAHVDMQLDSNEAMHGTISMNTTGPSLPQGMASKSTVRSKFLNSDCGDLKPGEQRDAPPGGY